MLDVYHPIRYTTPKEESENDLPADKPGKSQDYDGVEGPLLVGRI
jgi:hypothetical protein